MPLSWHGQISTILDAVIRREPRKILDIGCGFGLYGAALRQYLPHATIVGVDASPPDGWLKARACHRAYDDIIAKPWPAAEADLGEWIDFDVALVVDVIEHCDLELGLDVIGAALHCSRAVVIATPHDPMQWPQDDLPNPWERHVRRWPLQEFASFADRLTIAEAHHLAESIVVVLER